MSVDKTTDGKVIWALRLYNSSGGFSPQMVRRDTLPVIPEGRQGYVRVEEYEELLKCRGEPVAEVTMRDPLILTTGNLHTLKVGDKLYTHADPGEPVIHPINMKTLMQAYEQVDHRALLHGTSNWCAAMATTLQGVLCSGPSAPVEMGQPHCTGHVDYAPSTVVAAQQHKGPDCVAETRQVLLDILRGVYHQGWSVGTDIPTRIELLLGMEP